MTGKLDRRITIQRATVERNAFNEPIETWTTLATRWANRTDASAGEAYRAQEVGAEIACRFTVRHDSSTATVTPTDRISYGGRFYNITQVREKLGTRNRWLEIDAVARADEAMADETSP